MLIAFTLVAASIAVGLFARGLRGVRIDDHPLCRGCGFDLVGAPPDAARCPECGRETLRPRVGHHRRRVPSLVAGLTLLLGTLLVGASVATIRVRGIDWRDHLPTSWVLREASHGPAAGRVDAIGHLLAHETALTPAQRDALAHAIVAVDRDPACPVAWRDWLAARVVDGTLPADVHDAFLRDLLANVTLAVRPSVRQGDGLPMRVTTRSDKALSSPLLLWARRQSSQQSLWVDGVELKKEGGDEFDLLTFVDQRTGSSWVRRDEAWRRLAPGPHTVEWTYPIEFFAGPAPMHIDRARGPLAKVPLVWRGTVTVLPSDARDVGMLPPDPGIDAAMRTAFASVAVQMPADPANGWMPALKLELARPLPADVAFTAVAVQDGTERPLTTLVMRRGETGNYNWGLHAPALHFGTADVILRADPTLMRDQVDVMLVWNGELRFPNVRVEPFDSAPPRTAPRSSPAVAR